MILLANKFPGKLKNPDKKNFQDGVTGEKIKKDYKSKN
jgi:hypothetical protein